ncbi:Uncharacterised protein [Shigella sonnei]|nr:Uncharacterised protein [Shigella sonnei]
MARDQPSVCAIKINRESMRCQAGCRINSIHGITHSRCPQTTAVQLPSRFSHSASVYWPATSGRSGNRMGNHSHNWRRCGPHSSHSSNRSKAMNVATSPIVRLLMSASLLIVD